MGTAAPADWKKLIPHAAADLFPMMDDEAFAKLKADIKKRNGLLHPILLHEGRIIDGRNRYRACCELNIKPDFENWSGDGSLVEYVWSLNGERRHMTPSQLGAVATEMLPMLEAEAKERQRKAAAEAGKASGASRRGESNVSQRFDERSDDEADNAGRATEQAAKIVGTNRQYVSDAKKIKEESPILFEQVKAGEITIPAAKRQLQQPKGECPAGGNHSFDKEACKKCHEPKPSQAKQEKTDSKSSGVKTDVDVLIEHVDKLIDRVNSLVARHAMKHNAQSSALVEHLEKAKKLAKSMERSWRNS